VDDATIGNGCLEVVSGRHHDLLPVDGVGCIHPDVAATLEWTAVEVHAGQALWFHSRTPHRSGANQSPEPRRALYPTYNARREGDLRGEYYQHKLVEFEQNDVVDVGRVRVSLIGDFQGRPVT
jgi:ectoine hydroxylase-related dioxygenase (phytanoyl-CoA dioxygenase family)